MSAYDSYAPVYDATGQGRAGARHASAVLAWIRDRDEPPRDAVDLACGAGAATLVLAEAGVRTAGLDRAPAMLAIASGRARDARRDVRFVEADILSPRRSPLAPRSYDLVTCFGALEELTGPADLRAAFAAAARLLRPRGRVAFDLPAPGSLGAGDEVDVVLHDGASHLVFARYAAGRAPHVSRRIVWFVREIDRWWRGEETHVLRDWSAAELRDALASAGMAVEARLPAAPEARGRALYVARAS